MATATEDYADAVTDATEAYLDAVRDCVELLPETLDRYGDPAFAETAERLYERESEADAHLRTLRELLGELAPPNYTDVYLRTGEVMRLYAHVDEVPDAAEGFVRDLETVEPTLSAPVQRDFHEMATLTVAATETLTDVTGAYVTDLVTEGDGAAFTDDIEHIAALEGEADAHRQDAVERVFAQEATTGALLVRDLAASLDGAPDAAEAAADHLLFMQGSGR